MDDFNPKLGHDISIRKHDIAYLADIFDKLNSLNLQLQGQNVNLIRTKSAVLSFINRLTLYKQNLCRREFYQFPYLQAVPDVTDDHCEYMLRILNQSIFSRSNRKLIGIYAWSKFTEYHCFSV